MYSSDINEFIIDYNLKFFGESYIRVDNIRVDNAGVNHDIKNIRLRGFLFSKEAFGENPIGVSYNTLDTKLNGSNFTFYAKSFGDLNDGQGLGNITDIGENIVENFSISSGGDILVGDFPNNSTAFVPTTDDDLNEGGAFRLVDVVGGQTKIIDEGGVDNPLYIAFWMKGDADRWFGTDKRKKRFQVYEIPNLSLFNEDGSGTVNPITFENGVADHTTTGGGGSGFAEAAAFKITSLSITINIIQII